jgi:hypothetical protein
MVVMDEEPRSTRPYCLFGLICQLFGYSHNTVALALALRSKLRACTVSGSQFAAPIIKRARLYFTPETPAVA